MSNRKWGHIQGQHVRFCTGHAGRRSPVEKFWEKVKKTPGCWLWTGARTGRGYGALYFQEGGKRWHKTAHRLSWEYARGAIPNGLFICHHCDNPLCVNPAHLFVGTVQDNNRDRDNKGRCWNPQAEARKAKTHCVRGHEFTPENTYWHPAGRRRKLMRACRTCRNTYHQRKRELADAA